MHTYPVSDALSWSALAGGRIVLLCERPKGDGYETVLVWCGQDGQHEEPLDYLPMDDWPEHTTTLLAHGGGCLVLPDPTRAFWHPEPGVRHEIPLAGVELLAAESPAPRLAGRCAVSDTAAWSVVLDHGILHGEARYAAVLEVDDHKGQWQELWRLSPADFPADRFGMDAEGNDPDEISLTGTLHQDGARYAITEGSDLGSVPRYGADFFACGTVAEGGGLSRLIHQESGWKRQSGKHGIRGRFTADGRYAVLTPVFRGGEWKGRQRLLSLADGELLVPRLPKGMTTATLLDGRDGQWWLRHGTEVTGPVELASHTT